MQARRRVRRSGARDQFALGNVQRAVEPRRGVAFKIEVGIHAVQQAMAAELGQAFVQPAPGGAEQWVAGVTQCQHAEAKAVERRCTSIAQLIEEATRVVRWIAVALRADHHVKQRQFGQFTRAQVGQ